MTIQTRAGQRASAQAQGASAPGSSAQGSSAQAASSPAYRVRTRPGKAPARAAPEIKPGQESLLPEATLLVRRAAYGMPETEEQVSIRVPVFHAEPARIRVAGSVTRNMLDNNFVKIGVEVELPCYPELSEITRAQDIAAGLVHGYIRRNLAEALGEPVLEHQREER